MVTLIEIKCLAKKVNNCKQDFYRTKTDPYDSSVKCG